MNGKLPVWIAGEKERWSQKYRWRWKVKFWHHCWGIFMMIRMMCPCKCWFSCISSTYQRYSLRFPFIRPWPWVTYVLKARPVFLEPNGNVSLLFHSRDCRNTQNSNTTIDKFIMQSERTNSGFHHLAHQQLFLMNYLSAPLLLACPLLLMW